MLMKYLTELKNSLTVDDFNNLIQIVERDIKINKIQFGKKTSQKEFVNICEIVKEVITR